MIAKIRCRLKCWVLIGFPLARPNWQNVFSDSKHICKNNWFRGDYYISVWSSKDILQLRNQLYSGSGEQFSNALEAIISIYFSFVRKAWYDERHFGVRCSSFLSSVAVLTVACTYSLKSSLMHCLFPFPLPSQHLVGPSVSIPNWKINIGGGSTFILQKTNIQDDDNILSKSCQPKKLSLEKVIKWQK